MECVGVVLVLVPVLVLALVLALALVLTLNTYLYTAVYMFKIAWGLKSTRIYYNLLKFTKQLD